MAFGFRRSVGVPRPQPIAGEIPLLTVNADLSDTLAQQFADTVLGLREADTIPATQTSSRLLDIATFNKRGEIGVAGNPLFRRRRSRSRLATERYLPYRRSVGPRGKQKHRHQPI